MRERAAEVGGEVAVERRPEGGTRVLARLPLGPGRRRDATPSDASGSASSSPTTTPRSAAGLRGRCWRRPTTSSSSARRRRGEEAVAAVAARHPDVVLMDVNMPGLDGVEATRRIVDGAPHVAVLVLTMHDDDETVFAAVRAGARGYLLKGAQRAELIRQRYRLALARHF